MLKVNQLRELIIKPALLDLVLFSEAATQLLIFTCAVESDGGTYLKQVKGPALGIYQMEPKTYNELWDNYIKEKKNFSLMLVTNFGIIRMPDEDRMIYDLRFASAMARLFYHRIPEVLPNPDDEDGIWNYYKTYWNTVLGKANRVMAMHKYHSFISG